MDTYEVGRALDALGKRMEKGTETILPMLQNSQHRRNLVHAVDEHRRLQQGWDKLEVESKALLDAEAVAESSGSFTKDDEALFAFAREELARQCDDVANRQQLLWSDEDVVRALKALKSTREASMAKPEKRKPARPSFAVR